MTTNSKAPTMKPSQEDGEVPASIQALLTDVHAHVQKTLGVYAALPVEEQQAKMVEVMTAYQQMGSALMVEGLGMIIASGAPKEAILQRTAAVYDALFAQQQAKMQQMQQALQSVSPVTES